MHLFDEISNIKARSSNSFKENIEKLDIKQQNKLDFLENLNFSKNDIIKRKFFGLIKYIPICNKCDFENDYELNSFYIFEINAFEEKYSLEYQILNNQKNKCVCNKKMRSELIRIPKTLFIWFNENNISINRNYLERCLEFDVDEKGFLSKIKKSKF